MNLIIREDIENILSRPYIDFSAFDGMDILITGATGLIGKTLCFTLLTYTQRVSNPPRITALVRSRDKALNVFREYIGQPYFRLEVSDIRDYHGSSIKPDYIIHAASETSSLSFINQPVETILTTVEGTRNLLDLSVQCGVKGFAYLSTMEVYGAPQDDTLIKETDGTDIDPMEVRSSYPESKRLSETLCAAYHREYNVPAKVLRLTQTFGPGVSYNDQRVFAQFARCAIEQKDIILHSKGETKRMYLYTADAAAAVLLVLLNGESGKAYNAANEDTYCTILEMAEYVSENCGDHPVNVRIELTDTASLGYAPVLHMNLDVTRLKELGWKAEYDLKQMFQRMISCMKEN